MSLRIRLISVIATVVVAIIVLLILAGLLNSQIRTLNDTWSTHSDQVDMKADGIYQIHSNFGYGGFIHHFKNLVLRLDLRYGSLAEASLLATYGAVDHYQGLELGQEERQALEVFRQVVGEYDLRFQQAKRAIESGISPVELDAVVRVDDVEAIAALKKLSEAISHRSTTTKSLSQHYLDRSYQLMRTEIAFVVSLFLITGVIVIIVVVGIARSLKEVQTIFRASPDALIVSDPEGRIVSANDRALALFGYTEAEFMEMGIEDLVPARSRAVHEKQRLEFQQSDRVRAMDERGIDLVGMKKSGEIFPAEIAISALESGKRRACISIVRDISVRKDLERQLSTDYLTKLANRLQIDKTLHEEIIRARRYRRDLSVILCDIDNFKQINDRYGHQVGDRALVKMAEYLQNRVRKLDTVARWGGEEFLLVCPETDLQGARALAEEICSQLESELKDESVLFTVSLGVARFSDQDDAASILKRADDALYRAKEKGRNRVEIQ